MSSLVLKNIEDSWISLTVMFMSLNANTPTLEMKETKTQTELYIVIDEMTYPKVLWEKDRTKKLRQHQQNLSIGNLLGGISR